MLTNMLVSEIYKITPLVIFRDWGILKHNFKTASKEINQKSKTPSPPLLHYKDLDNKPSGIYVCSQTGLINFMFA